MKERRAEEDFTHRQEEQLLKAVAAAIQTEFRNPERYGCPEPAAVRSLAQRRIPLSETGDLVDHIATCAPCFETYTRTRRRRRIAKVGTPILSVVILFALAMWLSHRAPLGPSRQQLLAALPPVPVKAATVDYRETSPTRSAEPQVRAQQTPHLPRTVLDLTILLPFGTEDGVYTVQFRSNTAELVVGAVGSATWDGTAETLKIRTDLRNVPAGAYTVAIRSANSSLHLYPVVLE